MTEKETIGKSGPVDGASLEDVGTKRGETFQGGGEVNFPARVERVLETEKSHPKAQITS
jgi:hypothetical protein